MALAGAATTAAAVAGGSTYRPGTLLPGTV